LNNKNIDLLSAAMGGHASFTLSDEAFAINGEMLNELNVGFMFI